MGLDGQRITIIFGLAVLANVLWAGYALTGVGALWLVAYGTGTAAVVDLALMVRPMWGCPARKI